MRWGSSLPLLALCAGVAGASPLPDGYERPAPAPTRPKRVVLEEPRPFARGSMNLGLVLGYSASAGSAFELGAGFGYFVLPGLEPGVELGVTLGSDRPTVTSLLPYLRWVIWRSYSLSPYVKVQGGRWFVSGQDDLSTIGGGGGLIFFLTRNAGLQLEGMVSRLFPSEVCGDSCTNTSIGFSLGFFFGNPPPLPRRQREPATDEPRHETVQRDEPVPWDE